MPEMWITNTNLGRRSTMMELASATPLNESKFSGEQTTVATSSLNTMGTKRKHKRACVVPNTLGRSFSGSLTPRGVGTEEQKGFRCDLWCDAGGAGSAGTDQKGRALGFYCGTCRLGWLSQRCTAECRVALRAVNLQQRQALFCSC